MAHELFRLDTLTTAQERWTPIYFEHGRLEVDDSSVKWIGADYTVIRIPVATVSALMLGPGTTVTHAAMKVCADCNTPVCWVGEQGMRFYSFGVAPTHDNARARRHAAIHASTAKRTEVARRMFKMRFGDDVDVEGQSIQALRGMEGRRVKALYSEMGAKYGVTYNGKRFDLPFLRREFGIDLMRPHLDLMYPLRAMGYRGGLKACERRLGFQRRYSEGTDGLEAVRLWYSWSECGREEALRQLAVYNVEDTYSLAWLADRAMRKTMAGYPLSTSVAISSPSPPSMEEVLTPLAL